MRRNPNSLHGLGCTVGIVVALLVGGCAVRTRPLSESPAPKPQAIVIEGGTSPVLVEKVIFRIASGARIGGVYRAGNPRKELYPVTYNFKFSETEEYNIEISDRLSELGYDAIDPTSGIFTDGGVKTRFRLVGVVSNLDVRTYVRFTRYGGRKTKSQAVTLDMEVRVYDSRTQSVIYQNSFSGNARVEGTNAHALAPAIMSAIEGALVDPMFSASMTTDPDPGSSEVANIALPSCDLGIAALPRDLSAVSEAVVGVRLGSLHGSGVIISPAGHVLTAAHLVESGMTPMVALASGLELEATVEALDKFSDVALLKIHGTKHQCVVLMSAERIGIGNEIYAIGSPLSEELSGTVTRGIVSGYPTVEGRVLIQTDAAVNPGNSGGPIFNQHAQVAGIVISKMFGFGVEGVAFAVPSETIRERLGLVSE